MNDNDDKKLESGEDLAISALAQAGKSNVGTSGSSTDDEVKASDELADTLSHLQSIIERNANELTRVKNELKEKRESFKSLFENDAPLQEVQNEVNVMNEQVKERKSKINSDPQATSLKLVIGDLNQEKKEIEETLSNHLINFYSMTNSKSFDTSSGDQWEFDIRAKVKGNPNS
ncbi:MAG: hypothetical protein COZ34_05000 [Candidatus Pacebacteria bacterium CG_4_10_14_3_um_filter_34_15]|nr:hypothetical protein [Candidatus Pacearchaeota archaeon]NCQ65874.1 hypothetical protein [Candidatus Paceibacterota bacterium]OIO44804.1 MAG: hypothetical protein AUJ41_01715 [Candidatus Pacebacteria bacterium CG1_02_43_31]PIQ81431.1 MAG: hypothetical protein COV78_00290 [Candidatus Pacebacteria bacterium CG11_big_fil_rev_8_21_14_0_20_34_55]PIX81143.1 MAG: hypothetical protein COZ34_05000 [Candidatus Pacebacteria bacterium CG_4_10_14_3_um_filter_34_15]PJC43541.1 MAG: hypothetical protein CO0